MMYKLVLVVAIFTLILIVYHKNPEQFTNPSKNQEEKPDKTSLKRVVCNIIPGFNNDYIGTFFPEKGGSNNTLITTRSLSSIFTEKKQLTLQVSG